MSESHSTPEMWLMLVVGMGAGSIAIGMVTMIHSEILPPLGAIGMGAGWIGVAILGYLWATRENYLPALRGENNA